MNIGVDCRVLSWNSCGIKRYLRSFLVSLDKIDRGNRYFLCAREDFSEPVLKGENFRKIILPSRSSIVWEQYILPRALKKHGIAVFHNTQNYGVPWVSGPKVVLTVHDLIPYLFPRFWDGRLGIKKTFYKNSLAFSINRAEHIIADSKNTRSDIQRIFKTKEKPIAVIPPGIDTVFSPDETARRSVGDRFGITAKYVFHLSGEGLNKNTPGVIQAFERVRQNVSYPLHLVIAGPRGQGISQGEGVRWVGEVTDSEMRALYSAAEVFLYPSIYEGFGLPILEAMACGVPVITSRLASIPEAGGDAVVYVDPQSTQDIAQNLTMLLRDGAARGELIMKGCRQVKNFSWDTMARSVLEVYRSCAS